jgi:IclR family pca regulon transcriptional regulator
MGRVLLAALPEAKQDALLAQVTLVRHTERTIVDKTILKDTLRQVRDQGYCILDEELEPSLRSIAVPVRSTQGEVVAAVNISTNAGRVPLQQLTQQFLPVLQRCAESISPFMV